MNYFAHGQRFIADPYFLAGTAVPDWLSVADRGVRLRGRQLRLNPPHPDPLIARLAAGVLQHCEDDARFHSSRAFAELSLELCRQLRDVLAPDDGFRPHFLGHILVELLLDDVLIAENPGQLEEYYRSIESLDFHAVQEAVNCLAPRRTERLGKFIEIFVRERFLSDYADDAKLLFRLNQVMRRVRLPQLPARVSAVFPAARRAVAARRDELLSGIEPNIEPVDQITLEAHP